MKRLPVGCWLFCLCIAGGLPAPAAAAAIDEYPMLPGSKAMAVVPGRSDGVGVSQGQPNDLLASLTALSVCDGARLPQEPECELRRLNDETVTSGSEIRERVPAGDHPLHLWRLTSATATVYLAGSVHILKPSLYPLPDPYELAFAAADHLVVEVDLAALDPAELQQKTMRYASLPPGETLESVVPEPLLARLTRSLARYGVPLSQVAAFKPAFLMNQLVLLRLTSLGYQGDWGVEQHFLQKVGDRSLLQLETVDEQLSLLFDQPMALQVQLLRDTLDQEPDIEPLVAGMITAWLAGDDEGFMEMFEAQSGDSELSRRFTEQLLDERNQGMAERIREFVRNGQGTYFVLVGAAHLIGENGIVALLDADGMRPERIYANAALRPPRDAIESAER